jgi:hypothetical protein
MEDYIAKQAVVLRLRKLCRLEKKLYCESDWSAIKKLAVTEYVAILTGSTSVLCLVRTVRTDLHC